MCKTSFSILWAGGPMNGKFKISKGRVAGITITKGHGTTAQEGFNVESSGSIRLDVCIDDAAVDIGANATRVTVQTDYKSFTFFLRDVRPDREIFLPLYSAAIVDSGDHRTYEEIAANVARKGLVSEWQRIEDDPEETYENACLHNRDQICPTWLGLSRDMRMFRVEHEELGGYWGYVQPYYHSVCQTIAPDYHSQATIRFAVGPGESCRMDLKRELDQGVLPIVHSRQTDRDVMYNLTAFATLETQPVSRETLRGSDWQSVYPNTGGHMLSKEQQKELSDLLDREMRQREEEVVCCIRVDAVNTSGVPRYAWFKAPSIWGGRFENDSGFGLQAEGKVFAISRLDGKPMPQSEMAVLLEPGESASMLMLIPHSPINRDRADSLARLDADEHLGAARSFWQEKLDSGASIRVPEKPIDESIRAGLLQCDINTLGRQDEGPLLATIGNYSPIGSESAPIIQFFDSMGWHDIARRCLEFFLARQRDDGFIQNFSGYQLETGPTLWTMGEHYRYTRDDAWVEKVKPNILRACEYLLNWRERNKKEEYRGTCYGLIDGKVADPEDFFHSFMLNGVSYIGLKRASEMLETVAPQEAKRLKDEASEFRQDIRQAFEQSIIDSPVIPLGDGTWCPSVPPWTEYPGALALYADGGQWWTHGAFGARDSLIGALYLLISEVLDPAEESAEILLRSHQELFSIQNSGLSQPYYCRHDYGHLKRGEFKLFLKTYYNQLVALQDRETYTFWEHYHHASQNKTHETGWFLMQTRWMLFLEEGSRLELLKGIPRRWMESGKNIVLDNVASYFGRLSLDVRSEVESGRIEANIVCDTDRKPEKVSIRLPHPLGYRAIDCIGGVYNPESETVQIEAFSGQASVSLCFPDMVCGQSKNRT